MKPTSKKKSKKFTQQKGVYKMWEIIRNNIDTIVVLTYALVSIIISIIKININKKTSRNINDYQNLDKLTAENKDQLTKIKELEENNKNIIAQLETILNTLDRIKSNKDKAN